MENMHRDLVMRDLANNITKQPDTLNLDNEHIYFNQYIICTYLMHINYAAAA